MEGGKVMDMKEFLGLLVGVCYGFLFAIMFYSFMDKIGWYNEELFGIVALIIGFSGVYLAESFTTFLYNIEDKRKRD